MPPATEWSRYLFCTGSKDAQGRWQLSDREPFRFQDLPDNRYYLVSAGDTLPGIAERAFPNVKRASGLFWVIADFQPVPILDATVTPPIGTELVIPSERTVKEIIFNESRRADFGI